VAFGANGVPARLLTRFAAFGIQRTELRSL